MKTRLIRIALTVALAALAVSCRAPATPTPTPRPTETPLPPTPLPPSPTPATLGERVNQGIDGVMKGFMQDTPVTACSMVAVAPDASGALSQQIHSFGVLAKGSQTPVDQDTEYEIGGLTKLFTATVLAVENFSGKMPIGDPAQKYMPDGMTLPLLTPTDTIRLEDLALHMSGFPRRAQGIGGRRRVDGLLQQGYASDDEMMGFLAAFNQTRPPGTQWEYSNAGYGLLGMAEGQALGDTYERVVIAILGSQLGLSHTRAALTDDEALHAAQGYDQSGNQAAPFATQGDLLAAAGLRSTPADLGIFLQAVITQTPQQYTPAYQLAAQALAQTSNPDVSQGLGWLVYRPGKPDEVFFKSGLTAGFSSYIAYSAVRRSGYAAMCNGPTLAKVVPQLNALFDAPSVPTDPDEVVP